VSDGQGGGAQGASGGGGDSAAAAAIAAAAAGAAAGGAQDGQQGGGQQGGQQPGGQQGGEPSWQQKFLPAELQGDETLARYGSVPDMAKAFVETRNWARGRVAVPAATDAAAFEEFAGKVRPADAKDYAILGPDGKPTDYGEEWRQDFHDVGLHPIQAQRLVEKHNLREADRISKITQAGKDEITAVELELGPQAYNMRLAAVDSMLRGAGVEIADIVPALEQVGGAGKALRGLFALAEKTGELAKVDGATVEMRMGTMTSEAAQIELDRMSNDPTIGAKLADATSPEYQRRQALLGVVAKARSR
jgi:hypothetical protein